MTPVFPESFTSSPLLNPPLDVGPLPNDIHWKIVLARGAFAAPSATAFVTSPLAGRVGVYRHLDAAGHVFGYQL